MSSHKPQLDPSSQKLFDELTKTKVGSQVDIRKISELYNEDDRFWDAVKQTFITDFKSFDKLLLKIHYKRDNEFGAEKRSFILKFLTIGYLFSNDLRYYNEFLFFSKDHNDSLSQINLLHFYKNLDSDGCHIFPLESRRGVNDFINSNFDREKEIVNGVPKLNISLLGSPYAFKDLYEKLVENNYQVENYYFSYDKGGIRNRFKNNRLVNLLYFYLKGVRHKYKTMPNKPADPNLNEILSSNKPDLALHQLGFIIKSNIIDAYKIGILNDHLGILPFVRGRSTLEYSILYGFPTGSTIHFIDEGVDTGDILWFYRYNFQASSINDLKEKVLNTAQVRLIDSISYINSRKYSVTDNKQNKGLQHFVIHPELINYINRTFFN